MRLFLILGPPASGKSTLGRMLADACGWPFFSVGDLIRASLQLSWPDSDGDTIHARAIRGEEKFDASFLTNLFCNAVTGKDDKFLIVDAGPGFDAVIRSTKRPVAGVFLVDAPIAARQERFRERRRSDTELNAADVSDLFQKRDNLYRQELHALLEAAAAPVFSISNISSPANLLFQALGAVTLAESIFLAREINRIDIAVKKVDSFELYYRHCEHTVRSYEGAASAGFSWPSSLDPYSYDSRLILLVKWGASPAPQVVGRLQTLLSESGLEIRRVRVANGAAVKLARMTRAHLGNHYVFAKWAERLPQQVIKPNGPVLKIPRSAYSLLEKIGPDSLRALWYEKPESLYRLKPYVWVKYVSPDNCIVNGHIPGIVMKSEMSANLTTAMELVPRGKVSNANIDQFRDHFLGDSNPKVAKKGSLRNLAWERELDLRYPINIEDNGFHLSSSYLEAEREAAIWFGIDDAQATTEMTDRSKYRQL